MKSPGWHRSARIAALTFAGLASAACYTGYDAAPTPCDDFCRATLRADCEGDKPHECVRECISQQNTSCVEPTTALTECYSAAAREDFYCEGEQQGKSTPNAGLCQVQRDELFACEQPVLYDCLSTCSERAERARLAFTGDSDGSGTRWGCPSLNDDCVCACYTLDFLGVTPTKIFFNCLESSASVACAIGPSSPPVQTAGSGCNPPGVFQDCTDAAESR